MNSKLKIMSAGAAGVALILTAWFVGVKASTTGISGPWRVADYLFMLLFVVLALVGVALLMSAVRRRERWTWSLLAFVLAASGLVTQEYARAAGIETRTQRW